MPRTLALPSLALIAVSAATSCDRRTRETQVHATQVDDRSRDPNAYPTSRASWALMQKPEERRPLLQAALVALDEKCSAATQATLKGGFEGTDLWQVRCADSGEWLVTVTDDKITAASCTKVPNECRTAWASVARSAP